MQTYVPTVCETKLPVFDLPLHPLLSDTPLLCTQAAGGGFTHFAHPSTYYAIDFRCPVGTPVVSVLPGTVVEVRVCDLHVTGARVTHLFSWNSILIRREEDSPGEEDKRDVYVEYVHIHHEGIRVKVGDRVERGDVLCLSGDAGFCPEPHLHLQVHYADSSVVRDCPSVPITLQGREVVAGKEYSPLSGKL